MLLFSIFLECFASETFTPITNMTPYIWNQIIEKMDEAIPYYQSYNNSITNFETFKSNMDVDVICSTFNNYMTGKQIDYFENCVFIIVRTNNNFQLRIAQNNNTHHESYPFIYLWQRSSSEIDVQYCNDSGTTVNGKPFYIIDFNTNGNISFTSTTAPYSRIAEVYAQPTTFINSIINCPYLIGFNSIQNCVAYYVPSYQGNTNFWGFFNNYVLLSEPQLEEPSGDTPSNSVLGNITTPSGDNGGNINLQPIQTGIENIQNQISGDTQKVIENQNQNTETIVNTISGEVSKITNTLTDNADDLIEDTKITSGDIESALGFEIVQDPYSNFWLTLTNNLKNALLGSKRSIDISFQNRTWTISLDEYLTLPAWLIIILTPFSTAFFTWVLVRQWKLILDKLSSGNIDSILKENSEERHF